MASNPEILGREDEQQHESAALEVTGNRMADILAEQARARVQASYLIAKKNPRSWDEVRVVLLDECKRPRFAEVALKKKPGLDKPMLTIRFAEAAQRAMTNLEPTRVIVYDDNSQRIVELGMRDLESNINHSRQLVIEKTVERKNNKGRKTFGQRFNSNGEVVYIVEATEDEMFQKESAMSSKWERQLTLKILRGDIQDECYEQCLTTQRNTDKSDPDAARKKLIDSFYDLGVKPTELADFLRVKDLDALTPKDVEMLRMTYAAIRDGDTNWRELCEERDARLGDRGEGQAATGKSTAAAKVADAAKKAAAKVADPKPEPQTRQTIAAEVQTVEDRLAQSSTPTPPVHAPTAASKLVAVNRNLF